jgi:hypothetical protein
MLEAFGGDEDLIITVEAGSGHFGEGVDVGSAGYPEEGGHFLGKRTNAMKRAPFTVDEVASLNAYQQSGAFHPFTCGSGNRTDTRHLDGEGLLVASTDGWRCPFCDYTQDWCHEWMADWSWRKAKDRQDELANPTRDSDPACPPS